MDRAKIVIKGEMVQEIGYRVSLLTDALSFGISNFYAYNTKIKNKHAVIVLIGAEKEIINNFYNYIRENVPENAVVSDFEMEDFSGNVMDIDKYLHLIQIEQLNKGIPAIIDIRDNTKEMLKKQDLMLEKQDTTVQILSNVSEELRSVKGDTSDMRSTLSRMEEKQDKMLDKQDTTIHILEKVSDDTSDMKSTFSRIEIGVNDTRLSLSSFIKEK